MLLAFVFMLADDNMGVFAQMGITKTSTDAGYTLLKKGVDYGTNDNYIPAIVDGVPALTLSSSVSSDNLLGIKPSVSGVSRSNPVLGVLRYYDDTAGQTGDGNLRDTFRYDGLTDDDSAWMWIGAYDYNGDGVFTSDVETAAELYKLDTDTWKSWSFVFPDPELTHDVGVGISGAKLFIHNRAGGPEAFSFVSFVDFSNATFRTVASDFSSGWDILQDSYVGPSISHAGSDYLEVTYSFDNDTENEWFTVGPTSPIPIGGSTEKIPVFDRNLVTILAKVEFIDAGIDKTLHRKSPLRLMIEDAEGEVFIVGPYRTTVSGVQEWAWFSLTGKVGEWHIWRDSGSGDSQITFPIKLWGIRIDDDPNSVNDESGAKFRIYEILVRTDETPPDVSLVNLISPDDGASFNVNSNVTFEWTPTDDIYSGMDGISDAYTLQISTDSTFSTVDYEYNFAQAYGVHLSKTQTFTSGGTYYWRVAVKDRMGNVAYTPVRSFTIIVDNEPPTAPYLLSPSNGAVIEDWRSFNLTLSWEASSDNTGVDHYTLQIWNSTSLAYAKDTSDTSAVWEVPDAEGQVVYKWNVTAYDAAGNTNTSSTWSFTVDIQHDVYPPEKPSLISPDDGEPVYFPGGIGNVRFAWSNVSDVGRSGVDLFVVGIYSENGTLLNSTSIDYDPSKSEFYFLWYYNTTDNATIYWNVTVKDQAGNVNFSATRSVKLVVGPPDATPPDPVELLSPADKYQALVGDTIKFSWSKSSDSGSGLHPTKAYRLMISNSTEFSYLFFDKYYPADAEKLEEEITFNFTGTFYWKVVARDFAGNTADSDVYSFEVAPNLSQFSKVISVPNPVSLSSGKVAFTSTEGDVVSVVIYNLWGLRVAKVEGSVWLLKDEESLPVKPGVYFYIAKVKRDDGKTVKIGPFKLVVRE